MKKNFFVVKDTLKHLDCEAEEEKTALPKSES